MISSLYYCSAILANLLKLQSLTIAYSKLAAAYIVISGTIVGLGLDDKYLEKRCRLFIIARLQMLSKVYRPIGYFQFYIRAAVSNI